MHPTLGEMTAILRYAHYGAFPFHAASFARSGAADVVRTFDHVVAPIVEEVIADSGTRQQVRNALLFASVKGGFLISSYSRMIGWPFPTALSTLGGSFARLYDDLIDDIDGQRLDERVANLFHGRSFHATTDFERLLAALHRAIREQLDRQDTDPVFGSLHALHEYQVLSRQQRDTSIPDDVLRKITSGKGGLANLVLFGLVRSAMSRYEQDIVMELGEMLQLMDDCTDLQLDLDNGITTPATRGLATLVDVSDRLRLLRPRLLDFYGSGGRQFVTVLYLLLVAAMVKRCRAVYRRWSARVLPRATWRLGPVRGRPSPPRRPLRILLFEGTGVAPRSTGPTLSRPDRRSGAAGDGRAPGISVE